MRDFEVAEKEGAVERKVQVSQITRLGKTWPRAPISLFAHSFHGIDSLGTRSNTLLRVDLKGGLINALESCCDLEPLLVWGRRGLMEKSP